MTPRLLTLSVVAPALFAGGLLLGAAFVPAAAQQTAPPDGQVAVRSDGSVYLIANGQRRWVATVAITDDELDAYPEGEPIYGGLAPLGASSPSSVPAAASPAAAPLASPSTGSSLPQAPSTASSGASVLPTPSVATAAPGSTGSASGSVTPTAVSTPTGAVSQIDPQLPLEVDVDGTPKAEPGDTVVVNLKTKTGASCELVVHWPDGSEASQPGKTADSRGRCQYKIEVPAAASAGTGTLAGTVREGGRVSQQTVELDVVPAS